MGNKKPKFRRQEKFRFKKLSDSWRRPRGKDSKMRKHKKGKSPMVSVGYRKPKSERGIHPSGYREFLVENPQEIEEVDPNTQAVRIASAVGGRKREKILERADERGIKVLNRGS